MASGGLFHGLRLWVNLPRAAKWLEPKYQDLRAREAALLTTPDGGALLRVIAGELAGHRGPGSTHTPMTMMHTTVSPGATATLPWRPDFNALVYVLSGAGLAGLDVVLLGGRPIREPGAWGGPFVMNTRAEVLAAFDDYQKGRLGVIPATYVPHGTLGGTTGSWS